MSFSNSDLHPALAAAITDRGYQQPTSVQQAVLDPSNRDRDLLVSARTGSGKTLAFGALLARSILDEKTEHSGAGAPLAVVIVPTRELANQVQGELSWLFARTPARIAVFTGGSDVRRDLKHLHGRIDLAVGTPGRLVDLVSRGALDLSAVRCVVIDEADEMLDMGFREDLEKILGGAAARTRTLLFSATLPKPILGLVAKYQQQPVRLDLHGASAGGAAQHEDIQFVAHLIGVGDRLAAVVNVLTRSTARRAIVFGTTRLGVGDLHRELMRRGFKAVVLSGDRVQAERNRALDALRQGDARVLVATNVAARGLDVPEVDLIVHAELPLDVESLTHRSGRTGRAGRKGTSVIIATVAERRRAERLLSAARLPLNWTPAPSAGEIRDAARAALEEELVHESADAELSGMAAAREMAARLVQRADKEAVIAALLRRELGRLPAGEEIEKVEMRAFAPAPRATGPRQDRGAFSRAAALFSINLGARNNAEPGWLLPLICRRGGVTRREVGAIRVGPDRSEFEIAGEAAADYELAAAQPDVRAPHVKIERIGRGGPQPEGEGHRPSARHNGDRFRPAARHTGDGHRPPARHPGDGHRSPARQPADLGDGFRPPARHLGDGQRPPARHAGDDGHRPPARRPGDRPWRPANDSRRPAYGPKNGKPRSPRPGR